MSSVVCVVGATTAIVVVGGSGSAVVSGRLSLTDVVASTVAGVEVVELG